MWLSLGGGVGWVCRSAAAPLRALRGVGGGGRDIAATGLLPICRCIATDGSRGAALRHGVSQGKACEAKVCL